MKEYVVVPDELFRRTELLAPDFAVSFASARALPPKPAKPRRARS